ncbi:transcriptional regulator, ArsR family [Chloroherpeton thalassium ATCC 35110]|uniref:Transcriptional regulator, ArsR family n=1 Tax=Chloroherpeton thalassium (strain ATCC 35110 / GB-78) TaxID=517418 RepID=B3QYW5_CHLT3|nr:metalloregulator ArsR/SmtB family transcription factor [Chloroherpeton thalassium]ACF13658.1 transcriptional regulator, ArsR family [Chloroherpeton thalassium ATCC 35110]
MKHLLKIFKALSDSNRLRIVKMLEQKPLCVCEIVAVLQLAPSTVSKHLSILREADLIQDDKQGKWVIYSLQQEAESDYVKQMLEQIAGWLNADKQIQKDLEKIKTSDRTALCEL